MKNIHSTIPKTLMFGVKACKGSVFVKTQTAIDVSLNSRPDSENDLKHCRVGTS